jgi:hypothetical protein
MAQEDLSRFLGLPHELAAVGVVTWRDVGGVLERLHPKYPALICALALAAMVVTS